MGILTTDWNRANFRCHRGSFLPDFEALAQFFDGAAWTMLILALASFVQAAVGFAAALLGLPLLLWAGNNLMEAQILIFTAMLPQNIFAVWRLKECIDYREIVIPATVRILAMPLGVAGLVVVMTWPDSAVNRLVGVLILAAILCQLIVGVEWKSAKRWYWILITFGGSGFLQGLSGTSGPPLVLWVHGQKYAADRARAFLFAIYVTNFIPQLFLLWLRFSDEIWKPVIIAFASLPFVLVGAALGLRGGAMLGDQKLRIVSYVGLTILALINLAG